MSYSQEEYDLYMVIMQCLQSATYAGEEFQDRAFAWLDASQEKSFEERSEGWSKLHAEYEELSKPYWDRVWKRIKGRREFYLQQGELFA